MTNKMEDVTRGMHLKFTNITMVAGDNTLLNGIYGDVKPGEVMAIMGPSGAGKTTLMSLLAGREKKLGTRLTQGSVTVNGQPLDKQVRRNIGYVPQEDKLFCWLTVRQTLQFYGHLRLSDDISKREKYRKVEEVMECLGLLKCADTYVGGEYGDDRGVSGGERKRTSIATEMMTRPSLLLMDEPTSGLDSSTASNIIYTLKKLARQENQAIVATIHQPSSQLFHLFDKVLLLCSGKMAYFGDVPGCQSFFDSIGMPCYANWNPADFLMEQLTANKSIQDKICDGFKDSEICGAI